MTDTDLVLRGVLAAQAFLALMLTGNALGHIWSQFHWPMRITFIGGMIVELYVLVGQHKAYVREIPFDGYSFVGLVGYTVLLIGLIWLITKERRQHQRGR